MSDLVVAGAGRLDQLAGHAVTGTLHALASTGGTVVCRALAAHEGVLVLSEISPAAKRVSRFVPDAPFAHLMASPLLADSEHENLFKDQMDRVTDLARDRGWSVLVRDHSHSDFMLRKERSRESSLHLLMGDALGRRVVLVRHPLDSYLSSRSSGFLPAYVPNLESYCQRLLDFDEALDGIQRHTYESFCRDPDLVLPRLCQELGLPFEPEWRTRIARISLSGSSGRIGAEVEPRPRREISAQVAEEADASASYEEVCSRWGYDERPAG